MKNACAYFIITEKIFILGGKILNAVKKSDIDFVMSFLTKYIEHIYKTRQFNLHEMIHLMEPVFAKAGYRKPPSGGGNRAY